MVLQFLVRVCCSHNSENGTIALNLLLSVLSKKRKEDIKVAIETSIDVLGFVANVTQNVPYLGVISGSLSEIMKICDVLLSLASSCPLFTGE